MPDVVHSRHNLRRTESTLEWLLVPAMKHIVPRQRHLTGLAASKRDGRTLRIVRGQPVPVAACERHPEQNVYCEQVPAESPFRSPAMRQSTAPEPAC